MSYNKYGNVKCKVDGITFDSMLEAKYYAYLMEQKGKGEIKDFLIQPKYVLQKSFKKHGKTHRKIEYVGDFEVHHNDGTIEVIDVKGVETDVFKLKYKLYTNLYEYPLKTVTYSRIDGGWITLDQLKKNRKERKASKGKKG